VSESSVPFWWRGKVVAAQTAIALVLAVAVAVLAPGTAGFVAAAFLVGSAGLRVLAWHIMRRERRARAGTGAPRGRPGS
jgi:hypothetical protein